MPVRSPVVVLTGGVFWNLYAPDAHVRLDIDGLELRCSGMMLEHEQLERLVADGYDVQVRMSRRTADRLGLELDGARTVDIRGQRHRISRAPRVPDPPPADRPLPTEPDQPGRPPNGD